MSDNKMIPEQATHVMTNCNGETYWGVDPEFGWFSFDENGEKYFPLQYSVDGMEELP